MQNSRDPVHLNHVLDVLLLAQSIECKLELRVLPVMLLKAPRPKAKALHAAAQVLEDHEVEFVADVARAELATSFNFLPKQPLRLISIHGLRIDESLLVVIRLSAFCFCIAVEFPYHGLLLNEASIPRHKQPSKS